MLRHDAVGVGTLKGSTMAALLREARGLLWLQATWEKQTRRDEDGAVVYVDLHFQVGPNLLIPSSVYLSSFNRNIVWIPFHKRVSLHAFDRTSAV